MKKAKTESVKIYQPMHKQETVVEKKQEVNQLKTIFENYFALKDALLKSN